MTRRRLIARSFAGLAIAAALTITTAASEQARSIESEVDAIFSRWTSSTPGCAVGVASGGRSVLERAYGLADLEHDVRNRPDTIFEAGSVAKQFTAAVVLLLAQEGKLSLDDPVRKYIPEVPDYGEPITIRQMLTHTSGLRDWGSVAGISGWPRTTRVHTHSHVLDIVARQKALNFPPGTRWSYSNTGYNLAVILVSRVAGKSFAEFSEERIFKPLGMTRTSWRDDHTRIVKGRAIAYAGDKDGFSILMPYENVHGNGGLLTTVGDLLRWNENFVRRGVGGGELVKLQEEVGRFSDGREHDYAMGLRVGEFNGFREIGHSGSTAGYRAHLIRYPDQRISVAVLCNVASGNAGQYAQAVASLYLRDHVARRRDAAPKSKTLSASEVEAIVGLYRQTETGEPLSLAAGKGTVRFERGPELIAVSGTQFSAANGSRVDVEAGRLRVTDRFGTVETYERVEPARPTVEAARRACGSLLERRSGGDRGDGRAGRLARDGATARCRGPADADLCRCVPRAGRFDPVPA
jgi:CubicO group peptidase (beta-lactamase class C family)